MLTLIAFLKRPWLQHRCWRFRLMVLLTTLLCIVFQSGFGYPVSAEFRTQPVTQPVTEQLAQPTTAQTFLQQGRTQYAAGEYAAAVESWRQAAQQYAAQNDGANTASALSNQALAHLQLGQYDSAESALAAARDWLSTLPDSDYSRRILAQLLNTEGQFYMAKGDAVAALTALTQATDAYGDIADATGRIRTQLNQAQILRVQGRWRDMAKLLQAIAADIQALPASPLKAAGLRQLATALQQSGDTSTAEAILPAIAQQPDSEMPAVEAILQESLAVAEQSNAPAEISKTRLSLGNWVKGNLSSVEAVEVNQALDHYRQAAAVAPTDLMRLQAQVNQLDLLVQQQAWNAAADLLAEVLPQLAALPPSRSAFYLRVNLASQLLEPPAFDSGLLSAEAIAELLTTTVIQAQAIGDGQGLTYGLGYLGRLAEQTGALAEANRYTQEALVVSQAINASEADYQWQWQLGRILEAQNQTDAAIAAYQQAIATLQTLRGDLAAANRDAQFTFREEVEPVYRNLVSLLLKSDRDLTDQKNLLQARDVVESLQVEELVNFFRADCVVTTPVSIDQVDNNAMVIYPIILPDRLEVLVSTPGAPLQRITSPVAAPALTQTLDDLQSAIAFPGNPYLVIGQRLDDPAISEATPEPDTLQPEPTDLSYRAPANRAAAARSGIEVVGGGAVDPLPLAQTVYDWLIRPLEPQIQAANPDVLVFVLDGALRNVPMAVLHDGSQYLIEKHAIALTPGLQLLEPRPLAQGQLTVLASGLSEERGGFSALPNVEREIEAIKAQVPGEFLLNQDFNKANFSEQVTDSTYPIVHLATHGQFSSDLEETFILAWDDRIRATELGALLQRGELSRDAAVEILILSACETASGDERAALGLAGVAVRSGARSTLATLWLVDDRGTSILMENLYQQLGDQALTKAEALRQAQLRLLNEPDYQHPYFWAPFVLVGNWL